MEIKPITEWEVETPNGWSSFSGVKKTTKNWFVHVFTTNSDLKCSNNHKLKLEDSTWKYAEDIQIGDILYNGDSVTMTTRFDESIELYDLLDVDLDNEYITNGLISHNCAFVDRIDTIWGAALPTLSTGGSAILLSTPNGIGNLFHKIWDQAESGKEIEGLEPFNAIKLKWDLHPERDQKWRDQQTYSLGERLANQECDCDFLSSGHTVVPAETLKWYTENHVKDPIQIRGATNDVWIWKFVDYTKSYLITADVARGDGDDNSTFHIFDIETLEQVAEYQGKMGTREFGKMLAAYGHEYNSALVVVDNKNIGWDTVQELIDLKYPNLYYSFKADPFMDPSIHLAKGYDLKNRKDMVPGFTITTTTRPVIISKIQMYMEQKVPIIHSKRTINELHVFMWIDGKPQAQRGFHDDLVIPLGTAFFIRDTSLRLRQMGIDLTKKALGGTHKVIHKSITNQTNPWSFKTPNGQVENLKWLL